jgi:hypothetical protein
LERRAAISSMIGVQSICWPMIVTGILILTV